MGSRVPYVLRVETTSLLRHCATVAGCGQCEDLRTTLSGLTGCAGVEGRLEAEYLIAVGHLGRVHGCEPSTAYLAVA